jgi:hypothetical protein
MSTMKKCATILMATIGLTTSTVVPVPTLAPHSPLLRTTSPIALAFAADPSQDQMEGQTKDTATFSGRALPLLRRLRGIHAEKVEQLEKGDTDWIKVFELNVEAAQAITQLEKTAKYNGIPPYVDRMESLLTSADSPFSDSGVQRPR